MKALRFLIDEPSTISRCISATGESRATSEATFAQCQNCAITAHPMARGKALRGIVGASLVCAD